MQHSRSTLLPFLLLLATAGVVHAVPDENDLAVNGDAFGPSFNTYRALLANNALISADGSGFCLSLAEGRVISNLSSPLYTRPITLMYDGAPGLSNAMEWVVKFLLQEVIGYQTLHYVEDANAPAQMIGTYSRTMTRTPETRSADTYLRYHCLLSGPPAEYTNSVVLPGANAQIVLKGQHSAKNRQGVYIPRSTEQQYPQYALNAWRSYTLSSSNKYGMKPLPDADRIAVRDIFLNDTWAALSLPALVNGSWVARNWLRAGGLPTGPWLTQPLMLGASGVVETGFGADPNFPGLYVPPQVLFAPPPNAAAPLNGYLQPIIRELNLSIVLAVVDNGLSRTSAFVNRLGPWAGRNVMVWSESTQATQFAKCSDADTGASVPCWSRIDFPAYTSVCDRHWTGNSTGSDYSCDFPQIDVVKLARKSLAVEAPRADYLLSQFDLTSDDFDFMFASFTAQNLNPNNHKQTACDWLRTPANRDRWLKWIAPPPPCTGSDFYSFVADCDPDTEHRQVVYQWHQPKACVGGVPLPDVGQLDCGYLSADMKSGQSFVAVAAFLLAVVSLIVGAKLVAAWFAWKMTRTASASTAAVTKIHPAGTTQPMQQALAVGSTSQSQQGWIASVATYQRELPVFAVMDRGLFALAGGLVLLLVLPLVSLGSPSVSMCLARPSLLFLGLVLAGMPLMLATFQLRNEMARLLEQRRQKQMAMVLGVLLAASVLLFILLAADATGGASRSADLLATVTVPLEGVESLLFPICTPPPLWFLVAQLFLHLAWMVAGPLLALQLLARTYLTALFGASTYQMVHKSRSKGQGKISRVQLVQVHSLALVWMCWVATAAALLSILLSPQYYSVHQTSVLISNGLIVAGVVCIVLALLLPSIFHHCSRRSQSAKLHRQQAAAIGGGRPQSTSVTPSEEDGPASRSLAALLSEPLYVLHLRRFAERSFDAEAIHFLLAAQTFLQHIKSPTFTLAQLMLELGQLCKDYIEEGAPQQVNVSSRMRQEAMAGIDGIRMAAVALAGSRLKPASTDIKAQTRSCLHALIQEVYQLVQLNSYPRFLLSSNVSRAQHLQSWADGFAELDMEEMAAMLKTLNTQMTLAKRVNDESMMSSGGGGGSRIEGGGDPNKNKEADVLLMSAEDVEEVRAKDNHNSQKEKEAGPVSPVAVPAHRMRMHMSSTAASDASPVVGASPHPRLSSRAGGVVAAPVARTPLLVSSSPNSTFGGGRGSEVELGRYNPDTPQGAHRAPSLPFPGTSVAVASAATTPMGGAAMAGVALDRHNTDSAQTSASAADVDDQTAAQLPNTPTGHTTNG